MGGKRFCEHCGEELYRTTVSQTITHGSARIATKVIIADVKATTESFMTTMLTGIWICLTVISVIVFTLR